MLVAAAEGFAPGDVYALGLAFAGFALFAAVGALAHQGRWAFTAAIVYLALGATLSLALELLGAELLDPLEDSRVIERLTEVAVIVALFSAGLKLDRPLGWRGWRSPAILLAVVMPLTIAAVAAFGHFVMGLSAGAAIILGGVLAPTDPVLAGDVQVGPPGDDDEPEGRFALTAEAGLNDGLAFPFVFLGIFVATRDGAEWVAEWFLADLLYGCVAGIALGFLGGRAIAAAVARLHARRLLDPALDGWLAIATVLLVYGVTEVAGAYGFLAAFAAGLAYRRYERKHESHGRVHSGAETVEQFAELAIVLLLGSTVTLAGLSEPGLGGWLLVAVLLFGIRPLVTILALRPVGTSLAERAFVGWFGIRGIGSFYYASVAVGSGALVAAEESVVYWTVIVCTGVSIVLHGISANPITRRLGL